MKNVVDMCNSGGFHLRKFISNDRELLISIPEDQRRNGVKNADLISADLIADLIIFQLKRLWIFNGISLMTLSLLTFR